ncbi:unnamed protein product [Toxocara canis]|uniref:PBPe domain-containing protein n=1 Tax=Toxocara canis TaxID=6265 RepID=A0A183V3I6_TOXCA|nr:unnamed protein product [Toxocara canis]
MKANDGGVSATAILSRKWSTYYTPENISLLLEAIIDDRRGDWRAAMDEPVIIWSHESKHHPDFGKHSTGIIEKETLTSRYMSFLILGVVIAFIVYAYLNHLFAMRVMRRIRKQERLRQLVHQSAFIMASSAKAHHVHVFDGNGRRLSILNLFHAFRL